MKKIRKTPQNHICEYTPLQLMQRISKYKSGKAGDNAKEFLMG